MLQQRGKSAEVFSYAVSDTSNTYYLGDVNFPSTQLSSGESSCGLDTISSGDYTTTPLPCSLPG